MCPTYSTSIQGHYVTSHQLLTLQSFSLWHNALNEDTSSYDKMHPFWANRSVNQVTPHCTDGLSWWYWLVTPTVGPADGQLYYGVRNSTTVVNKVCECKQTYFCMYTISFVHLQIHMELNFIVTWAPVISIHSSFSLEDVILFFNVWGWFMSRGFCPVWECPW